MIAASSRFPTQWTNSAACRASAHVWSMLGAQLGELKKGNHEHAFRIWRLELASRLSMAASRHAAHLA